MSAGPVVGSSSPAATIGRRPAPLTVHQRMSLLEPLARGRTLAEAAAAAGVGLDIARQTAIEAGHPDVVTIHRAWIQLRRQLGLAETKPGVAGPSAVQPLRPAAGSRLVRVPLDQLHPDPDNPREELPDIDEMASSLAEVGMLQPIVARVHERRLVIVMGHRRYAGAQRLGWNQVDVLVNPELRPEDVLLAMLTENSQRRDLDPIEEAIAVRRLIREQKLGSHARAAARLGRAASWVSSRLALLDLSPRDQELVRSRQMTLTEAVARSRHATRRTQASPAAAAPHFGAAHPLAAAARARCRGSHLHAHRLAGAVACGPCWESTIRDEATQRAAISTTTQLSQPARAS